MENTPRDNTSKPETEIKGYPLIEISPGMYAIDISSRKPLGFFDPAPSYVSLRVQ